MNVPQSESAMRRIITKALRDAGYEASAVDNEACDPGMPDVWYFKSAIGRPTTGWLELKHLDAEDLPKREDTPVRVPKYRPGQRIWHRNAQGACLPVHVLLLAGDEWLLLTGFWACNHLGNVPLATLREAAVARWTGGFNVSKLIPCL